MSETFCAQENNKHDWQSINKWKTWHFNHWAKSGCLCFFSNMSV